MLLLQLASLAAAQEGTGEIRGWVRDNLNKPSYTAQIFLHGPEVQRTVRADQAGFYFFSAVPAGEYELTIEAPSFHTSVITHVRVQGRALQVLPPVDLVFEALLHFAIQSGFEWHARSGWRLVKASGRASG